MGKKEHRSNYFRILGLVLLGVVCLLSDPRAGSSQTSRQPKRLETAAPGDCQVCHGNGKVLPTDHVNTKGVDGTKCDECHKAGTKTLRTKIPLSHIHQLSGVVCADCHEKPSSAEPLTTEQCLSCHSSFEEVANATIKLDPNPHNSPHYGTELDCDLCHHQHSKSENFCAQCHEWELRVP